MDLKNSYELLAQSKISWDDFLFQYFNHRSRTKLNRPTFDFCFKAWLDYTGVNINEIKNNINKKYGNNKES